MLDGFMLSRIQFAANISFHILFPTITIALAWFLVYFRYRHIKTQDNTWLHAYQFWIKIFALTFALGVVSGITMSFQFGTNWPGFMNTVGNVAGPLLAYEVLTAFFLEATFLGIMLFGRERVPPKIHLLACFLVAFGTTLSAFWIMVLNSWMQTPDGHEIIDGIVHVTDWYAVIFNPSMPYRFIHMLLASGLTASFLIMGISAYRLNQGDRSKSVNKSFNIAIIIALLLSICQLFSGDLLGLNTLKHQPQKIAAMEGIWETQKGASLILFSLPDEENQRHQYEISIPNLASVILTHKHDGEIKGLNEFPNEHPPVAPVFWSFRIMVGIGLLMIILSAASCYYWFYKKQLPLLLSRSLVLFSFSGWIATLSGWYVTEIGRQPFLVSGILTTAEAQSNVAPEYIATSLLLWLLLYPLLIAAYIATVFYLSKKASRQTATKKNPLGRHTNKNDHSLPQSLGVSI